jgi:hypothetical protein
MKSYILFLLILFPCVFLGQQSPVVYELTFVDSEYPATTIRNAEVLLSAGDRTELFVTNRVGQVQFETVERKIKLHVSHTGYIALDTVIAIPLLYSAKVFEQTIALHVKTYSSKEVVIQNPYIPVQVFGSERISVEDFELLEDNKCILLTYERRLNKGSEVILVDENEKILSTHKVGKDAKELIRDFQGHINLLKDSSVYKIEVVEDELNFSQMDASYFKQYIDPIIDTVDWFYLFSNYQDIYPAVDFFSFDKIDSSYLKLLRVEDKIMMEMYLSEYKYVDVRTKLWAWEMQQELGIDKEIIIGATVFTSSMLYKELYAPLFVKNDTIYVFDYYKEMLFTLDRFGKQIDSVSLTHHIQPKKTGWKNKLIQDTETGIIYAVYERVGNTILRPINLKTGELERGVQLYYRYVDKLALRNNTAFYTYRPFESAQKKFLYSEKLPLVKTSLE